jgi:hypothetical protein
VAGNGSFSQAPAICSSFVQKANVDLHFGVKALAPRLAPALFSELAGLSRRMQFLQAPAGRRKGLARWATDLDQAATTANKLGAIDVSTAAGFARFASGRDRLALDLERANADAARLGLRSCRINLHGHGP